MNSKVPVNRRGRNMETAANPYLQGRDTDSIKWEFADLYRKVHHADTGGTRRRAALHAAALALDARNVSPYAALREHGVEPVGPDAE